MKTYDLANYLLFIQIFAFVFYFIRTAVVPADSTPVAPMMPASASVPLAPQDTSVRSDMIPTVPLAPIPDPSMQPSNVAPMAPMPDGSSTIQANPSVASATQPETSAMPSTTTTTTLAPATGQSSVPLAPFPSDSSAQAQKGSATSFVIFNISVYTAISILIASIF